LVLAAAGLLRGYKATSHWAMIGMLAEMGAMPVARRVVEDRNRITGAGVTGGLDFGLKIVAKLRNEKMAKAIQLAFEYDPQPPFRAETPNGAGEDISGMMMAMYEPLRAQIKDAASKAN
jgi:cyclohexyl-isocyanide hydratase